VKAKPLQVKLLGWGLVFAMIGVLPVTSWKVGAVEVTGTLGSPSATTTIDGKQLPAPDPKFGA
jgi:arylsulfatase